MQTLNNTSEQETSNTIKEAKNKQLNEESNNTTLKNNFLIQRKLSDYVNSDHKFLQKNKEALKEYELFLNRSKYKKKATTFGSVDEDSESDLYKNNPKLIIISYKTVNGTSRSSTAKKKFNNNVIGVDEGLITLPKLKKEEKINPNKSKKDEKTIFNKNNNINLNNHIPKTNESYDKTNKKLSLTESARGEEIVVYHFPNNSNSNILSLNNSSNKKFLKNKKIDDSITYKTMIRRLNKWDQIQLSKENTKRSKKEKKTSRSIITDNQKIKINNLLKEINQTQLNWFMDLKNNPEELKIMNRNQHLKNFVQKINEEQNAISIKNIYINKKGFNFDVFNNDYDMNDQNIINKDAEEERLRKMGKIDLYCEIMKEKMKLEDSLTHEMTICAEEVYKSKLKHKSAISKLVEITTKIQENEKKQDNLKNEHDDYLRRLEYLKQSSEYLMSLQKNAKKNKTLNGSLKKSKKKKKSMGLQNNNNFLLIHNNNKTLAAVMKKRLNYYRSAKKYKEHNYKLNSISNKETLNHNLYFSIDIENEDLITIELMKDILRGIKSAEKENTTNIYQNQEDKSLLIKNQILTKKNDLDIDFNNKLKKLLIEKKGYENLLSDINKTIDKYSQETANLKNIYNQRIQGLIDYYYQILKKGIDVRRHGLVWVVAKLIELSAVVDKSHFPNFLNDRQVTYLLTIGVKSYELKELIKLFQYFKHKQKYIKEQHIREDRLKEKIAKEEELKEIKRKNKNKIGDNYAQFIEGVQLKYENAVCFNGDEEVEDKNIFKTSEKLKHKIITMDFEGLDCENKNNKESYFIPGSLGEYFSRDAKFREYFDDSFYLNEEIKKRQAELKKMKEDEMKHFINKNGMYFSVINNENEKVIKTDRGDCGSNSIEKIYAALFGNGISV